MHIAAKTIAVCRYVSWYKRSRSGADCYSLFYSMSNHVQSYSWSQLRRNAYSRCEGSPKSFARSRVRNN